MVMKNNFYDYVLEQLNLKLQLYDEKREEIDDEKDIQNIGMMV